MKVANKILRIEEVSALTGIPIPTLRFWRHQGTGPRSAKFGGRIVYREHEVQAWIEEQFDAAPAEASPVAEVG